MAERHRLKESERSETVSATQYQAAALQHKAFWVMPDTLKRTEGWWDKTVTEGKQRGPQGTDRGIERGQMTREGQQTVNQEQRGTQVEHRPGVEAEAQCLSLEKKKDMFILLLMSSMLQCHRATFPANFGTGFSSFLFCSVFGL